MHAHRCEDVDLNAAPHRLGVDEDTVHVEDDRAQRRGGRLRGHRGRHSPCRPSSDSAGPLLRGRQLLEQVARQRAGPAESRLHSKCGLRVNEHRRHRRVEWVEALGEEGREQSGEDIAAARRGQRHDPDVAEMDPTVGSSHDGFASLEHHHRATGGGELHGKLAPPRLHVGGDDAAKTTHLRRMRRDNDRLLARTPVEATRGGDVEPVSVDDGGCR